jgi:nucleoside triphosphate pyrophosphatase
VILASGSPRRADLLRAAGIPFRVIAPTAPEPRYEGGPPRSYAMEIARLKAREVAAALDAGHVVGADTVVLWRGQVLGKPADRTEARSMLERLSGDRHEVLTAVAVVNAATGRFVAHSDRTALTLRPLGDAEVEEYLDSGEPMDKAGAYALQGGAAAWVTKIEGDRETVIGLPTRLVRALLQRV